MNCIKFAPGQIVATPGALEALQAAAIRSRERRCKKNNPSIVA